MTSTRSLLMAALMVPLAGCGIGVNEALLIAATVAREAGTPPRTGTAGAPVPSTTPVPARPGTGLPLPLPIPSAVPSFTVPVADAGGTPSGEFGRALAAANRERAKVGSGPLRWSDGLAKVAKGHSEDMARRAFFDHDDPEGDGPGERLDAAGIDPSAWGENIALNDSDDGEEVIQQWMDSPPHRENMLDGSFTLMGLGTAKDADGSVYWTQVFSDP